MYNNISMGPAGNSLGYPHQTQMNPMMGMPPQMMQQKNKSSTIYLVVGLLLIIAIGFFAYKYMEEKSSTESNSSNSGQGGDDSGDSGDTSDPSDTGDTGDSSDPSDPGDTGDTGGSDDPGDTGDDTGGSDTNDDPIIYEKDDLGTFTTTHAPLDGVWGHVEDHSCCLTCTDESDLSLINCGPGWGLGALDVQGENGVFSDQTSPDGCGAYADQCSAEWPWETYGCMPRDLALRRATSLSIDRTEYSMYAYHRGGRTDCSGYLSLVYGFGYNYDTNAFRPITPNISEKMRQIDEDEILPGDVIWFEYDGDSRHVTIFGGFVDDTKESYYALEQSGSRGAVFRINPTWFYTPEYYGPFYIIRPLYDSENDWLCEW